MDAELLAAFPDVMVKAHKPAILAHRLRREIIATKLANRMVNRLGMLHPFELAEEEGCGLGDVAAAFAVAERIYDLPSLWHAIDTTPMPETARLMLFNQLAVETRAQMADIIRNAHEGRDVSAATAVYAPVVQKLSAALDGFLPNDIRLQTNALVRA